MTLLTFNVAKVLVLAAASATLAFLWAPALIRILYKFKFWKKQARTKTISGEASSIFTSLHQVRETSVPRGGGLLIWVTTLGVLLGTIVAGQLFDLWWLKRLNFLSRAETWLPIFTLVAAALIGLADDILVVFSRGKYIGGGLSFWRRLAMVVLIGLVGAWWFYVKLGWSSVYIPLFGDLELFWLYPILFVLVMIASWASGVVDGLDGLSGGVFMSIFGSLSLIAFWQGNVELAAFGAVIIGALFAFLWYNIPPARFYMGETGALALTCTMAVFAFLTDSVVVLPVIAGVLVLETGSVVLQLLSKKLRGKKIWLSTPIHHHFEAKGWPVAQIVMRFWILGLIFALIGTALRMIN